MKLLLALVVFAQAVPVSPPPQPAALTLPRGALYVTATVHPPDVLMPGPPGSPLHPSPPSHLPNTPWFDDHARAALIACIPGGYSITVMRRNGEHVTQNYTDQETSIDASVK